jgi:hypothetical protein
MLEEVYADVTLLRFDRLAREPGLVHAVTTRPQNYAPHRGSARRQAIAARRRLCEILSVPFDKLTSPEQVHGGEILDVGNSEIGCGRDGRTSAVRFVDGLICDRPGVPIMLLSADCPLVCAYDPDRPAVGAVHASWQGTMAHASENLVTQMRRVFGSDPSRLLTAISPSAGPCCYEVSDKVRRIAEGKLDQVEECFSTSAGRLMFNLWAANRRQLLDAGALEANIEVAGSCSVCDERFFSHRRQGADAGRFALMIALRGSLR